MSVACIVMIPAKVSGVMYTVDPNDSRHSVIMISAVWGLAADAVEGAVATDFFQVDKRTLALESQTVAEKKRRLKVDAADGVSEESLPPETAARGLPVRRRAAAAGRVRPEARAPLRVRPRHRVGDRPERPTLHPAGAAAEALPAPRRGNPKRRPPPARRAPRRSPTRSCCRAARRPATATASGSAYVIESDHMLHHIPEGVVVVARQTSPRYVPLMGRIRAFITDVGSVTGHMASVAREFRIPTLVGTGNGTAAIGHGEEITVDATRRVVYRGRVDALLKEKPPVNPMKNSPTYNLVKSVLKRIAPAEPDRPAEGELRTRRLQDPARHHPLCARDVHAGDVPDHRPGLPGRLHRRPAAGLPAHEGPRGGPGQRAAQGLDRPPGRAGGRDLHPVPGAPERDEARTGGLVARPRGSAGAGSPRSWPRPRSATP